MVFAAIVIGLITAYYLGLRAGGAAAAAAAALFLLAAFVPALKLVIYAAVGVGVAGVCIVGPHRQRPDTRRQAHEALRWARRAVAYLRRRT